MTPHVPHDSSSEGTIVNPVTGEGEDQNTEDRDTNVEDEGDMGNDLRFSEEERLIREQGRPGRSQDAAGA